MATMPAEPERPTVFDSMQRRGCFGSVDRFTRPSCGFAMTFGVRGGLEAGGAGKATG